MVDINKKKEKCLKKIAISYNKIKKYRKCIKYLKELIKLPGRGKQDYYRYQIALCQFKLKEYKNSLNTIDDMTKMFMSKKLYYFSKLLSVKNYMALGKYEKVKDVFYIVKDDFTNKRIPSKFKTKFLRLEDKLTYFLDILKAKKFFKAKDYNTAYALLQRSYENKKYKSKILLLYMTASSFLIGKEKESKKFFSDYLSFKQVDEEYHLDKRYNFNNKIIILFKILPKEFFEKTKYSKLYLIFYEENIKPNLKPKIIKKTSVIDNEKEYIEYDTSYKKGVGNKVFDILYYFIILVQLINFYYLYFHRNINFMKYQIHIVSFFIFLSFCFPGIQMLLRYKPYNHQLIISGSLFLINAIVFFFAKNYLQRKLEQIDNQKSHMEPCGADTMNSGIVAGFIEDNTNIPVGVFDRNLNDLMQND